jgi:hypothetical protein
MSQPTTKTVDPVLVHARREVLIVLGMWLAAMAWTIGYCGTYGYDQTAMPTLIFGIPRWVLWGIFVPWTVCTCLSSVLALVVIRDADLGEDPEEKPGDA